VGGRWAPYGSCGGVARPLGITWPPWGRGRSPGPLMAAVGVWPVSWVPYGRPGGVAGPLRPVWPPWGLGRSAGPRMAAVGAWPVTWAPYGRRGGVSRPLDTLNDYLILPVAPFRTPWPARSDSVCGTPADTTWKLNVGQLQSIKNLDRHDPIRQFTFFSMPWRKPSSSASGSFRKLTDKFRFNNLDRFWYFDRPDLKVPFRPFPYTFIDTLRLV